MDLHWQWCGFSDLDAPSLYAVLQARQDVFVLEQQCLYADIDGRDAIAHHLMGWDKRGEVPRLAAYLRALPRATRFAEASIGRVITARDYRAQRLGHPLMAMGIARIMQTYGEQPLRISAQSHLQKFYQGHGFVGVGDTYLEDNIPHREMLRA